GATAGKTNVAAERRQCRGLRGVLGRSREGGGEPRVLDAGNGYRLRDYLRRRDYRRGALARVGVRAHHYRYGWAASASGDEAAGNAGGVCIGAGDCGSL